jgi:hypothetical protein
MGKLAWLRVLADDGPELLGFSDRAEARPGWKARGVEPKYVIYDNGRRSSVRLTSGGTARGSVPFCKRRAEVDHQGPLHDAPDL